ncbi:MAG: ribosome-associated translation inhibitor RaiA [Cyanobacteriota bacterium]|nr:ribosome-associated translation inhibitor RaiA [Cyanobacteriota bacterium]MDY6364097.1 ribosome-associated translation inhibitor RaiA [Cyanobacteriota bacterium]
MHIHVNGKNIEITDAIKSYVKEKIGKVAARYDQIQGIDVVLTVIKNPAAEGKHIAEVICKTNSGIIHCEEAGESMYASIDLLADKFARQITKFKDKNISSSKESIRDVKIEREPDGEVEIKAMED